MHGFSQSRLEPVKNHYKSNKKSFSWEPVLISLFLIIESAVASAKRLIPKRDSSISQSNFNGKLPKHFSYMSLP